MQNAYWIQDDGRVLQTVPLKDIYGETFDIAGSDTFRVNPINSDLLLVSAPYVKAPTGAAVDSMGLAAGFFLYEVKSHRRTTVEPGQRVGPPRRMVARRRANPIYTPIVRDVFGHVPDAMGCE